MLNFLHQKPFSARAIAGFFLWGLLAFFCILMAQITLQYWPIRKQAEVCLLLYRRMPQKK